MRYRLPVGINWKKSQFFLFFSIYEIFRIFSLDKGAAGEILSGSKFFSTSDTCFKRVWSGLELNKHYIIVPPEKDKKNYNKLVDPVPILVIKNYDKLVDPVPILVIKNYDKLVDSVPILVKI